METQMTDILRGYAWKDGVLLDPIPETLFPKTCTPDTFIETLKDLGGCFSVIIERGDYILAGVDIIRSYPLFWAEHDNELLIGDNACEIWGKLGKPALDMDKVPEFLMSGVVIGNDTLFPGLKQLEAGQCVIWKKTTAVLMIKDYYVYRNVYEPVEDPLPALDIVHEHIIQRLIDSAGGRTIVIPLSGGNDSRLIAVMLKRLGYTNVICYTYGSSHLPECQTSRRVAKFLNFPWHVVEHNRRLWFEAFNSDEMKRHFSYATHLSVEPHIQDWLAVRTLKERGLLPEDSLIVPGHSGDFPEGANLPQVFEDFEHISERQLLEAVFERHFNLWSCPNAQLHDLFGRKLSDYLQIPGELPAESAASIYDIWDWRNREAKFIVNSVRVYEFFGYGWRLPLWDRELLDFWARIPLADKMHQNLYKQYKQKYQSFMPESSNNLTIAQRVQNRINSRRFGHLSNSAYGRFIDYSDREAYLNAKVADLIDPNFNYPSFINKDLPVLRADINALQALVWLKQLQS
jgi:asparagine synthase (glutamine-hydrolysing)